eukprot:TCONS_00004124-protein
MASRRILVQLQRNGGKLFKTNLLNNTCNQGIRKNTITQKFGSIVPIYNVNCRSFTTEAQDPGVTERSYKRINISQSDNDFINSFGLVMNENDEAISVVLGNQMRRQLWEGCHTEEESRMIKMATQNMNHLFFNKNLSEEEDYLIKLCSSAPDSTIFPYVFKYDDTAFMPYAFPVDYMTDRDEVTKPEATQNFDMTVDPKSFRHSEIRKKAGIFYTSESDFPENYDDEPPFPKSSNYA